MCRGRAGGGGRPPPPRRAGVGGGHALAAAQGVELRGPRMTSPELEKALAAIRARVASLDDDRFMANDLKAAADLVATGALAASVDPSILPVLEAK